MMPILRALTILVVAVLGQAAPAAAHKASDAYLSLERTGDGFEGRWDIALRDLETGVGLDADGDGRITWGELQGRALAVQGWALATLELRADGTACTVEATGLLVDHHADGAYAVLPLTVTCPPAEAFTVDYRLLAGIDALHRGLLRWSDGTRSVTAVLGPDQPSFAIRSEVFDPIAAMLTFLWQGVLHIGLGFDHVLFLVSLLLPAVLHREDGRWVPVERSGAALVEVAKVVTAFTLAHSLTLTAAALGVVSLPSRLIESVIALSIVLAALNNLFPVMTRGLWRAALVFGLVHGFGFAGALAELGLPRGAMLPALLAFNLGVELGQLGIVALFLPLAMTAARTTGLYAALALRGGSCAIIAIAAVWLAERALDVAIFVS